MADFPKLSAAHVLLFAVHLTSEGDLPGLARLVRSRFDLLGPPLFFRLLLSYYPTDAFDHTALVSLLRTLEEKPPNPLSDIPPVDASITQLSQPEALHRCKQLNLQPLPQHAGLTNGSALAACVIELAHRLELLNGTVQPSLEFVEAFVHQDPALRSWYETYLLPVVQLQYHYYPDATDVVGVQELEKLEGTSGVKALLKHCEGAGENAQVGRDLGRVVAPWIHGASKAKRRRIERADDDIPKDETSWDSVNEWLLTTSLTRFELAAKAFEEWDGPAEEQLSDSESKGRVYERLAQTGFAVIYACQRSSQDSLSTFKHILAKSVRLANIVLPDLALSEPNITLLPSSAKAFTESDLLLNALLTIDNSFTKVTESSMYLLLGLLATQDMLLNFKISFTVADLVHVCIFNTEQRQKEELRRILQQLPRLTRKDTDWHSVRRQLIWLHSWKSGQTSSESKVELAFLAQLPIDYLETQILDSILAAGRYDVAAEIYLGPDCPLQAKTVEARIIVAIYEAYDNATNGNRDRGGMRRAFDLLKAFQPSFPQSSMFTDIEHLIKATHSLSFYQLTLQHGVPFKPVSIRVQKDPLALVGKVLEQDSRAYTKLDDLLEIGRNLVQAHVPGRKYDDDDAESIELRIFNAEHNITYLAILAALSAHDFDTAYAYITSRLSKPPGQISRQEFIDDTSWRAAYAAGKYRPGASPKSLQSRIANLSQRMELLSRALTLAPTADPLSEILGTWRRCEEEMDSLRTQAIEEERAFEARNDEVIPGGFGVEDREADLAETRRAMAKRTMTGSGPSYEEEAPLGLFDVAKGAASALRKSAFPLGTGGLRGMNVKESAPRSSGTVSPTEYHDQASLADSGRVRKRDMVSNMVTTGIVSGMGWVLGAQPVNRDNEPERTG